MKPLRQLALAFTVAVLAACSGGDKGENRIVLGDNLTEEEKSDLVAFLKSL